MTPIGVPSRNSGTPTLGRDLGASEGSPAANMGGRLDNVAIYGYALTQQQVAEHYTAGKR